MQTFKTKSGSVYELDQDAQLIRRVTRSVTSTAERVADEWRPYGHITGVKVGSHAVILWGEGTDQYSPEGIPVDAYNLRLTETSEIVELSKS